MTTTWHRCDAYFSEQPRYGPFWFGVSGESIVEVREEPPAEGEAKDLGPDAYIVPLLSDTHAHVYLNPWPLNPAERSKPGSEAFEVEVENGLERMRRALALGIGFVRDMGDPQGINLEVRRRIARKPGSYPAMQAPGPAIHRPKKYGRILGVVRETLPDILELIDKLAEEDGVDFIKVVSTGIVDFATQRVRQAPQYTEEELRAVARRAAKHGLKAASHCSGGEGLDRNIAAEMPFIEHAYFVRPDQLERMAEQGLYWTPTFAPVHRQAVQRECGWDAAARRAMAEILSGHNDSLAQGHRLGAPILAGTDAGSPGVDIGAGLFIEMQCMARSLPAAEVLRIATAVNADACGHAEYTGRLGKGQPASFGVYRFAPWQDLGQLEAPAAVYHRGQLITA